MVGEGNGELKGMRVGQRGLLAGLVGVLEGGHFGSARLSGE